MPQASDRNDLVLATHDGEILTLGDQARRRHTHIIGGTGSGKTTLIRNLIAQDLAAGRGVGLIDPLGHLAEATLALVPPHRAHEVVYLNAADFERPLGFNVLEAIDVDRHALVADDVVSAFVKIFGESAVGTRSQQVLRNSVRALLWSPAASLLCIPRLLADAEYRERVVRRVADPVVSTFWRSDFASYDERRRVEVTGPILNKLDAVLSAGSMRNIIGQVRSSFDLRRTMDESRILVVNLAKGRIGESNAHLLGALLVTKIAQAAFAREDTPQHLRRPFYLYTDEFQDYASAGAGFLNILSQARNYGLVLAGLAHQYLGQLDFGLRDAVIANAANSIVLRVGAADAPLLAAHLGLEPRVEFSGMGSHETPPEKLLSTLPNFRAYARILVDDTPSAALPLELFPDPPAAHHRPHDLIAHARHVYGRDRAKVEAKIARFLRP